jgi:hypothetical protein
MNQHQWGGYNLPQLIHFLNAEVISENNHSISINLPVHLHEIIVMHILSMKTFLFVWFEQILKIRQFIVCGKLLFTRNCHPRQIKFEFNQFGFSKLCFFNDVTNGESLYLPARLHRLAELTPWIRLLGSLDIYKFGLCNFRTIYEGQKPRPPGYTVHRLEESISGLLKSLKIPSQCTSLSPFLVVGGKTCLFPPVNLLKAKCTVHSPLL